MAKHILVLDTNVIVASKYRLDSPTWRLVFALVRMDEVRLIVPEIVVREAVGRYRSESRKAREALGRLGMELESHNEDYETELRSKLSSAGIPLEPSCSMLDLADKAIYRLPPFNQGGNGFRDAMVWAHVLDTVEAHGAVVFLTGDGDFLDDGKPPKLRKALVDESRELVSPFRTVEDWISTIDVGDSPPGIHASAAEKMVSVNDHLTATITAVLESQSVAVAGRGGLNVEVTAAEVTAPVALMSLKQGEGAGAHLAVFRATVKFALKTPGDHDEPMSWTTGPFDVTGTMPYNPESDEFGEPEFELIEVPPPPGPVVSLGDVSGLAAALSSMSEVSRLSEMRWENSGLAAALASLSDASKLIDAQRSGMQAALESLPKLTDHPAFKFNALNELAEQQSAIAKIAADSINKSYIASLRPLVAMVEQMRETYGWMFAQLEEEASSPDDQAGNDEPDE